MLMSALMSVRVAKMLAFTILSCIDPDLLVALKVVSIISIKLVTFY